MRISFKSLILLVLIVLLVSACSQAATPTPAAAPQLEPTTAAETSPARQPTLTPTIDITETLPGQSAAERPFLAAGAAHTSTIDIGGVVRCWGDNSAGHLGDSRIFWQTQ
jgi:hypothetical protein